MARKKRGAALGQHFLTAPWAARAVAHAVPLTANDTVLEIGPGKGILTRELLARAGRVIAVEKDLALIARLNEEFADAVKSGALVLVSGDIRDGLPSELGLAAGSYALAANIPYYITGDIIRAFLTSDAYPRDMTLLVQREVAERIARDAKESILSLSVKAYGTPSLERMVPRRFFRPPPSVDSAILAIRNISKQFFTDISEEAFFSTVRAGFASKRKLLASNLASVANKEAITPAFESCGIDMKARAEDVELEKWKCLAVRTQQTDS